jgi:hypothetical protein
MDTMKYGAYHRSHGKGIVWFRTGRPLKTGFYHRHARRNETPDVCIAESVPTLIMKVYPWIRAEEADFQEKVSIPGLNSEDKKQISDQMTEQWVNRLDPKDDKLWVEEPHWLKHLEPA